MLYVLIASLIPRQQTWNSAGTNRPLKPAFHDADTDTDILADILARMSVSASWNAGCTLCL